MSIPEGHASGIPRRSTAVVVGLVAGLALAAGVPTLESRGVDPGASDHFWSHFFLNAVSQNFESVVGMMEASDVVVIGRLGPLEPSRSWVAAPELGADGIAFYAKSALEVEEVVHGDFTPSGQDTLDLELFVPVPGDFGAFRYSVTRERTMFFLLRKDEVDTPTYGMVSANRGYIRDLGHAEPPIGADDEWLLGVREVPFEVLARQLTAASRQP